MMLSAFRCLVAGAHLLVTLSASEVVLRCEPRRDSATPSNTVIATIDGSDVTLTGTSSGDGFEVTRDGRYVVVAEHYDSNADGLIDFKDDTRLRVSAVAERGLGASTTIDGALMFDLSPVDHVLVYVLHGPQGFSLVKRFCDTGEEKTVMSECSWIAHPRIDPTGASVAAFVNDERLHIANAVVLFGKEGARTVSRDVGNGWSLGWLGSRLVYGFDLAPWSERPRTNRHEIAVWYDPTTDDYGIVDASTSGTTSDKTLTGWPAVGGRK